MDFDRSSATHIWSEGGLRGCWFGGVEALSLYKYVDSEWWVFSSKTGWRKSKNNSNWFSEEQRLGYFRKLTKEERNGFTA